MEALTNMAKGQETDDMKDKREKGGVCGAIISCAFGGAMVGVASMYREECNNRDELSLCQEIYYINKFTKISKCRGTHYPCSYRL